MSLDFFHNVHKVPPDQLDMALDACKSMYPNMIPMVDLRPSYPEAVLDRIVEDDNVKGKVHVPYIPPRPVLKPNYTGMADNLRPIPNKGMATKWSHVLHVGTPRVTVEKSAMYKNSLTF